MSDPVKIYVATLDSLYNSRSEQRRISMLKGELVTICLNTKEDLEKFISLIRKAAKKMR